MNATKNVDKSLEVACIHDTHSAELLKKTVDHLQSGSPNTKSRHSSVMFGLGPTITKDHSKLLVLVWLLVYKYFDV